MSEEGAALIDPVRGMEQGAREVLAKLQGNLLQDEGPVRLGLTEGFGNYFVTPLLPAFSEKHPIMTLDLMPMPRFIKFARNEADIAITIEKPRLSSMIVYKLYDYHLRLYASRHYVETHGMPKTVQEAELHYCVGYVDDLIFSDQLTYPDEVLPNAKPHLRSTSIISQYKALQQNIGIGILPCFMADSNPEIVRLLEDEISIKRSFWIVIHPDQKHVPRNKIVWDYLKEISAKNKHVLLG